MIHVNKLRPAVLVAVAGLAVFLGGCLERIETITVRPDRSADMVSLFKGDLADMDAGDALPSAGRSWSVEQTTTKAADGGDKVERKATLHVPVGAEFPGTYATDANAAAVSLRFPTEVTTEVRGDGVYYHFSRVYEGRSDAPYTATKRRLTDDKKMRALVEADAATLTRADRATLIEAFRNMELDKHGQFVAAGVKAIADMPQDTALRIEVAVKAAAQAFDTSAALDLLEQAESPERDAKIAALAVTFDTSMRDALTAAVEAEPLSAKERTAFITAYDAERVRRDVTEDLMDERWEVRLTLPGEVVAHNADSVDGTTLVWKFDGAAMMDMDKALRATSVLRGAGH